MTRVPESGSVGVNPVLRRQEMRRDRGLFPLLLMILCFAVPAHAQGKGKANVTCKDGTMSAASGRGACSGHGGVDTVATKATKASRKAAKAEAREAQAK